MYLFSMPNYITVQLVKWLLVLTVTVPCFPINVIAASGYDENTQVVVSGKVKHVAPKHNSGLSCITIKSHSKQYQILTAPGWYARKVGINFMPGSEIQVVGSKFYGVDGNIYLMARSIKSLSSGRYIALRDKECQPLWQVQENKGRSCMRIFYHPKKNSF